MALLSRKPKKTRTPGADTTAEMQALFALTHIRLLANEISASLDRLDAKRVYTPKES